MLLEYLGIDSDLPSLGPSGLCSAYQKFKAITNATPKVMGIAKDAEWKAQFGDGHPWLPTIVHFINIFVAIVFMGTGIPRNEGLVESAQGSAFNQETMRMLHILSRLLT